jgi:hypothetical protein
MQRPSRTPKKMAEATRIVQAHLPLREAINRERTIGEVLDLLVDRSHTGPASTM